MRMKKIILLLFCVLSMGCSPARNVAEQALQAGIDQNHNVMMDLATIANVATISNYTLRLERAFEVGDIAKAIKILDEAYNRRGMIDWLSMEQYAHSRSLMRKGQSYIWSKKHFLRILQERHIKKQREEHIKKLRESGTIDKEKRTGGIDHELLDLLGGK